MIELLLWAFATVAEPAVPATAPGPGYARYSASTEISLAPTPSEVLGLQPDGFDRMTVPVSVAGNGPYRFLVDTGSDRTAISSELADKLNLTGLPLATLHSATGASDVRMAILHDLIVGGRRVGRIDAPLLEAGNIGADGVLGLDVLRMERLSFDFRSHTMSIVTDPATGRADDHEIVVRARRVGGRLIVTDAEIGGQPVSVVIDTGSQVSVANLALRSSLELTNLLGALQLGGLTSVTGRVLQGDAGRIDEMRIGPVALQDIVLLFAETPVFRQLGLGRRPAVLLGMNALAAFEQVQIDFAHKRLLLVLPSSEAIARRR